MSSQFDGITFRVFGDGGQVPTTERDGDGVLRYRARIKLPSVTARNGFAARLTMVTPKRIYGRAEAALHLEGGHGPESLTIPTAAGTLGAFTAILVGFTDVRADLRERIGFTADAEWIIVS